MTANPGIKYTPLRHLMLAEIKLGKVNLYCRNHRQSLWRPEWNDPNTGELLPMTSAQSRAVNDIVWQVAETPAWNGGVHEIRIPVLTEAGAALLAEWNWRHGDPLLEGVK